MDKKITIITGSGDILGMGHIQRMLSLAVRLNHEPGFSASIFMKQTGFPLPEKFRPLLIESIPSGTDLIIHDKRDSSVEQMQSLRRIAPVLTVDDSGPGREYADHKIYLLPIPSDVIKNVMPETSLFLYGYNFIEGIRLLKGGASFQRDIDVAVYAGYDPSPDLISSIKKSIPERATSVLLAGGRTVSLTGKPLTSEIPYPEAVCRTKIIVTHFGLTMFEADACGCAIAALNPTQYHSTLTGIIRNEFNIIFSAEYSSFSALTLQSVITAELEKNSGKNISFDDIMKKINSQTENFINYIKNIVLSR